LQPGYKPPEITPEPAQTAQRFVRVQFQGKSLPMSRWLTRAAFDPQNMNWPQLLFGEAAFGSTSDLYKKLIIDEQRVQFIQTNIGSIVIPA